MYCWNTVRTTADLKQDTDTVTSNRFSWEEVNLVFVLQCDVLEVLEFPQVPQLHDRIIGRRCQVVT